jgi:DNA-binding CsgD family transcriptional regulator
MNKPIENTTAILSREETELHSVKQELHALKIALQVLTLRRSDYRDIIRQNVVFKIDRLVKPYLEKLLQSGLSTHQIELAELICHNLDNISSPGFQNVSSELGCLTPTEFKVANLIRIGKTNKEIAELLNRSLNTIQSHRFNLRKKLGISNRKVNLRSYLETYTNS